MLYMMISGDDPGMPRNTARLQWLSTSPVIITLAMALLGPFIAVRLRQLARWIRCWSIGGTPWSNREMKFGIWAISQFDNQQSV